MAIVASLFIALFIGFIANSIAALFVPDEFWSLYLYVSGIVIGTLICAFVTPLIRRFLDSSTPSTPPPPHES